MKCLHGDFPLSVGSVLLTVLWQGNSQRFLIRPPWLYASEGRPRSEIVTCDGTSHVAEEAQSARGGRGAGGINKKRREHPLFTLERRGFQRGELWGFQVVNI